MVSETVLFHRHRCLDIQYPSSSRFSISEQQCEKAKRMVQHNMETMFLKKEKELIFITGDDIEL